MLLAQTNERLSEVAVHNTTAKCRPPKVTWRGESVGVGDGVGDGGGS